VSDRRRYLTLLAIIAVALAGTAALAVFRSPTLGLDLQGGLEVVLKANPPKGHTLTADDLNRSIDIMRNRIDKLGVSEPEIRKQGSNQIVIQLAGVHDPASAAKLIGKTAVLQFYDFENDLTGPSITTGLQKVPVATGSLFDLLNAPETRALADKGTPRQWYLFNPQKVVKAGPAPTRDALLKSQLVQRPVAKGGLGQRLPKGWTVLRVPQNTIVVSCDPASGNCISAKQITGQKAFYLLKFQDPHDFPSNPIPEMTGADLKLSGTRADIDPQTNGPVVLMQFTGHGKKVFHEITRREAQRGSLACQGASSQQDVQRCSQHFAIVLDNQIQSVPYIDFRRNPDGIPGDNGAQIDMGGGSLGDAKKLALVLQTGALPVTFTTAERTDVSATLGKDSLNQAKKAALVGLLVVALFLLLFYRFLGVVAVIGLAIYAAFLYAAILLFHVTLTLPGFAGLILTIGVAADANVVVFERIKEEVRAGKSVRAAISAGYSKGFHTILDANVVTAITALVLFAVATAQVKGFALMLLIGTVISLITAVAATRAMLGLLAGFSWFNKPRFMGAQGQQTAKWLQIDFMGKRYLWFALSGIVIVLGIAALGVRGLNLGIDFKGGTQLSFKTPVAHTTGDIRQVMSAQGYGDAVIQGRGPSSNSAYKSFQIRTKALSGTKLSSVTSALEDKFQTTAPGATTVSSSFGRQIAKSAIVAILFSLFLVVLYITIRFDLKFAIPVILAMLHDVLICVGIYALVGREVTSSTVAAILTVLGYSIYDTIIIFDRIRENIPLMRRSSFATIANVSLWETIRRSLATSFITLLPVLALFLFGGATLKDFAFALIVGIASGAYSSIFIAAPLLTIWKEREPEFARRRDVKVTKAGLEEAFEEAEEAAAAEPAPELAPVATTVDGGDGSAAAAAQAKRERRRQRRRARPHGRAR
jgi:SecD/SecF fusion protein